MSQRSPSAASSSDASQTSQMIAPEFLDLEEVLEIHALQLDEFGGIAGVRDRATGLLRAFPQLPNISLQVRRIRNYSKSALSSALFIDAARSDSARMESASSRLLRCSAKMRSSMVPAATRR